MVTYMLPFPTSRIPKGGQYGSWYLDNGKKRANMHHGVDFAPGAGVAIPSVADGVVTQKGVSSSVGCWTEVLHADGVYAIYCHSQNPSPHAVGARVSRGQTINYVGARGNVTGPHLHLTFSTVKTGGLNWVGDFDPVAYIQSHSAVALTGTQRQVLPSSPVLRRTGPGRSFPEAGAQLEAGVVGNFNGWAIGENVNGVSTWFRGISGDWFWAGGFTDTGTHDLTQIILTSKPTERVVGTVETNVRNAPSTAATVTGKHAANAVVDFPFFTKGQSVTQNGITTDVWFVDAAKTGFSWAGGYTSQATTGMTEFVPEPPFTGYYKPEVQSGMLLGIDVSKYQAGFDFAAYKATGEQFAILKRGGSNAGTYIDSEYAKHLVAARAAGLKIGHYWFNGRDGVRTPTESAQAFLRDLDIQPGEVVVLDIENEGAMLAYTPTEALEWLGVVQNALGVKPFVYMSAGLARNPGWGAVKAAGYPLWVAMYSYLTTSPKAGQFVPNDIAPLGEWGDGNAWQMHQWTSSVYGTIPGTAAKSLDRNIARADTFTKYGFVQRPDDSAEVARLTKALADEQAAHARTAAELAAAATALAEEKSLTSQLEAKIAKAVADLS